MSTMRVGVIGAGAMGTSHVRTLAALGPGRGRDAVYDADVARAKEVAPRSEPTAADAPECADRRPTTSTPS